MVTSGTIAVMSNSFEILCAQWTLCRTLSCGNGTWQQEYADLHAKMLRKEVPPRYIVAIGENGECLAPCIAGFMAGFEAAATTCR